MKNILSYDPSHRFTGAQIKEWIRYQLSNNTSHAQIASKMQPYLNIDDKRMYHVVKDVEHPDRKIYRVSACKA